MKETILDILAAVAIGLMLALFLTVTGILWATIKATERTEALKPNVI